MFASEKLSVSYSRVQLIFDTLMSLVLIIPSDYQRVQCGIWLFCEITFCIITLKMKPFKNKKFTQRTNLISVLFVLLAMSILVLIQTQETHQVTLSLVVTLLSGFILAIDMLLSLYIVLVELYLKLKKKKYKKRIKGKGKEMVKGAKIETKDQDNKNKKILPSNFESSYRTILSNNMGSKMKNAPMKKSNFAKRKKFRIKVHGNMKRKIKTKKSKGSSGNSINTSKYNSLSISKPKRIITQFSKKREDSKSTRQNMGQNKRLEELKSQHRKRAHSFESNNNGSNSSNTNILSSPQ